MQLVDKNKLEVNLGASWLELLEEEFSKDYMISLKNFLQEENKSYKIYPPAADTFNAFKFCPFENLKVVILGQDPYHGPNQAHGLCFSVRKGIAKPPSLVNIFKELNRDLNITISDHGELSAWASQGVFLLNTCLSVRDGQAASHFNQGWERFTDKVIEIINLQKSNVVFMLWGAPARAKAAMLDTTKHLILEAPHPSPLSAHRGFLGCGHFSKANSYLEERALKQINWTL
jgi:uracil-DNA glycosylase